MLSLKLYYYLSILPFIGLLSGYFFLYWLFSTNSIATPLLIGKNLNEAVKIISDHNLNIRILKEKEDRDLPEGTIISQIPMAHQTIRPNQIVFCVVSSKPPVTYAPYVIGKKTKEMTELFINKAIYHKSFPLPSHYPEGYCLTQIPAPHKPLTDKTMITYVSAGSCNIVIFPSLIGKKITEVQELLDPYGFNIQVFHSTSLAKNHQCTSCVIADQKPLPGSFIDLKKTLTLHINVEEK